MIRRNLVTTEELRNYIYDSIYNGNYVIYVLNRMLNLIDVDNNLLSSFSKNSIELLSEIVSDEISYYESNKDLLRILQNIPEYRNQMSFGFIKKEKLIELYKNIFSSIFNIIINSNNFWINLEIDNINSTGLINIDEKLKESLKKNVDTFLKLYLDPKNEDRNILLLKLTIDKVLNKTLSCRLVVEEEGGEEDNSDSASSVL